MKPRPLELTGFEDLESLLKIMSDPEAFTHRLEEMHSTLEEIRRVHKKALDVENILEKEEQVTQKMVEVQRRMEEADRYFTERTEKAEKIYAEGMTLLQNKEQEFHSQEKFLEDSESELQIQKRSLETDTRKAMETFAAGTALLAKAEAMMKEADQIKEDYLARLTKWREIAS